MRRARCIAESSDVTLVWLDAAILWRKWRLTLTERRSVLSGPPPVHFRFPSFCMFVCVKSGTNVIALFLTVLELLFRLLIIMLTDVEFCTEFLCTVNFL